MSGAPGGREILISAMKMGFWPSNKTRLTGRAEVHDLELDELEGAVRVEGDGVRLVGAVGGDTGHGQPLARVLK